MAVGQQPPEQYTVPQLARIFHQFPHVNVSMHKINNTFNPTSPVYGESLGILGSVPAALLILTLLVLLVYLVTRCCDRKPRHRRSIALLKCCLAILAILCCCAVAVGLYGNDDVHNGLVQLIAAAKNIDGSIMAVRNQTDTINQTLTRKVSEDLLALKDLLDAPVTNKTILGMAYHVYDLIKFNESIVVNRTNDIRRPLGISLAPAIELVEKIELYRWPVTMAVLSALLILCVVLLVGVARHSRCALITFSVFGLFAVITSWLMASIYLAGSVALGDLCVAPDEYISRAAPSPLAAEVFSYYTHCENARTNPFTQKLLIAKQSVDNMRRNLEDMKRLAFMLINPQQLQPRFSSLLNDIIFVDNKLTSLTTFLDCKPLHKQYVHAAKSLCHFGLFGLTLMLLASVASGFLFTVLVWVDSHTWIYIRKRNDYHQVNEQDPYLPPSAASQAIAARTLRGQGGGGLNGSGIGDHKSSQHNQQTSGRADHRAGLGDQPGQYATLSKQCKTLESSDFY
ncbi:protein tweety isoform X2 [Nasonia vitripennis]|uniref:Protein tweety homolog n=1 Tax=Nasonia vitripennis TaxID=7425 RepID=A0A7M7QT82_NASVI|nr:protein tweety isoform X2 [Nasonia vitripennis]